jgi:hypothetical protein
MDPKDLRENEEPGVLKRVAERARETAERAKEGMAAGASGVAEFTRTAAHETRERASRVVEFVSEAEADAELKQNVTATTEHSLDRAGDALIDAAPAIGRGVERAAEKTGQALHAIARPLAVVLGAIAGTLGGWWKKASEERVDLPAEEERVCRAHFATITVMPAEMTFDQARTGYSLGYIASRNPAYRGRGFEEIEPDLRQGFRGEQADEYDALREFTRYGYDRGMGRGL